MAIKGTMGIVGCYGLSDQILRMVEEDEQVGKLLVVANEEGERFERKVKERNGRIEPVMVDGNALGPSDEEGFSILLWLNPESLHDGRNTHDHHREVLSRMADHVDAVFFFYGLCRSPELRLIELRDEAPVPTIFLTDLDGEIVDDCFAAVLGGKKDYLEHIMGHKHALLVTTGYAESWRRKRERSDLSTLVEEVEGMRYMFQTLGYDKLVKLDDGVDDGGRFDEDVRAFSRLFDLELEIRLCRSPVFAHSYAMAKKSIQNRSDTLSPGAETRLMSWSPCGTMRKLACACSAMAWRVHMSLGPSCQLDADPFNRTLP